MSEQKTKDDLKVIVNYPAAKGPFEQEHASPTETVGALKSMGLTAFGLPSDTTLAISITTSPTLACSLSAPAVCSGRHRKGNCPRGRSGGERRVLEIRLTPSSCSSYVAALGEPRARSNLRGAILRAHAKKTFGVNTRMSYK
jgi:hypothetical protein